MNCSQQGSAQKQASETLASLAVPYLPLPPLCPEPLFLPPDLGPSAIQPHPLILSTQIIYLQSCAVLAWLPSTPSPCPTLLWPSESRFKP